MRILSVFFLSILISVISISKCRSQVEFGTINTSTDVNLHERMMYSTYRIAGEDTTGYKIEGTCLVLKSHDSSGHNRLFLATAKHVLDDISQKYAILHYPIRSDSSYNYLYASLEIRNAAGPMWISHEDSTIDIAVLQIDTSLLSFTDLVDANFLANEELLKAFQIKPGDELFAMGFPLGASSNEFGFPILKGGFVASYPILPTSQHKYFLIDCELFPASSGSPVYVRQAGRYYDGLFDANCVQFICGMVVSRHFAVNNLSEIDDDPPNELVSIHLAKVIPSTYILELIDQFPK